MPRAATASASACSGCRARAGTTTTRDCCHAAGRSSSAPPRASRCRARPRHCWSCRSGAPARLRSSAPSCACGSTCCGTAASAPTSRPPNERHGEIGDRANDAVRVDGREVRARVVGEGGNLGFSQRGRIEYAAAGGRINTDFIDNSAGVNTSDVEVNLKILLDAPDRHAGDARRGAIACWPRPPPTRSPPWCCETTTCRARRSASWNGVRSRTWASISSCCAGSSATARSIARSNSCLTDEEMEERRREGRGLTRPELALLFAYGKIALNHALTETRQRRRSVSGARTRTLLSAGAAAPLRRTHQASPAAPRRSSSPQPPTASSIASVQRC